MSQNICNICGANYEYRNSRWVCPGCGAYKEEELSNEEVTLFYNAAQKLRFADFDEAEKAYTDIIEKYPQNHNGYWGRLLSKYGIKYEEDFDGHKIPTCYATSIESVVSDKDYAKAISLADEDTKEYYQKQAEYIERVRKEWVEKARKEKPYDIFICYKDSDLANGIERTRDSVEALELYNHLQAQGYRVFFSRESLRNKVGEKYEPYIFNALSTAKVMLVYGTSSEYITSTWLKNEWTRYEKRMEAGEKLPGSLIVACDGFSPNELPKILSSKQCFDAKRKTFYIDLDKCIKRLIQESPTIEQFYAPKSKTVSSELHEHVYKTKIVKATCVAKGYTIHKCDCGYEYRDSYTPLVDHKFKIINEVSPTCTTSGYKEMACDVCGEKKKDALPALGHNYSKWVESKHPTCTDNGEKQRKCTHCGEIEKQTIPASGHAFDGITVNGDGTQTSYCSKCGCSQTTKTINESERAKRSSNELVISFTDILFNIVCYWKSFFTSETTKMQKIMHFIGLSLLWSFVFGFATTASGSPISTICLVWVVLSFLASMVASIAWAAEMRKYKQQGIPYPSNKYVRTLQRLFAYLLLFFSLSGISGFFTIETTSDKVYNAFMGVIFGLWFLLAILYAYFPKQYRKIRFTQHSKPISKRSLSLIVGIINFILLMIAGSITS